MTNDDTEQDVDADAEPITIVEKQIQDYPEKIQHAYNDCGFEMVPTTRFLDVPSSDPAVFAFQDDGIEGCAPDRILRSLKDRDVGLRFVNPSTHTEYGDFLVRSKIIDNIGIPLGETVRYELEITPQNVCIYPQRRKDVFPIAAIERAVTLIEDQLDVTLVYESPK